MGSCSDLMDEVIGHDRRLSDLDRDDCTAFRDLSMRLPANAKTRYPNLSFTEIANQVERDGLPPMNAVTVNSHLHKMSTLFNYAVKEERMDRNPAKGARSHGRGPASFLNSSTQTHFCRPNLHGL